MSDEATRDRIVPGSRWEFDGAVTEVFDDMLQRSIPQYDVMRDAVTLLAGAFLPETDTSDGATLIDIGCSRGEALARVAALPGTDQAAFLGLEISEPMVNVARGRFAEDPRVHIVQHDLRNGVHYPVGVDVILSVLTLKILSDIYKTLKPGGAFILVEKTLGEGPTTDDLYTTIYHAKKVESGYTPEDVERKRLSLEGVLVPLPPSFTVDLLQRSGFREIDRFWSWMNFSGWVAIK